ncbi:MAG: GNAT family protein [Vicinamibacterales bacterium]
MMLTLPVGPAKSAPPRVETERLVLAPPAPDDAAAIFERYASDADVTRYVGWPRHRNLADTESFLAFSAGQWAQTGAGPYLIRARHDGQLLGGTGLQMDSSDLAMTGYVLAKDAWGLGYATEALRGMIDVARGIGVAGLYALCHPAHRASWHVLEKCGFERDPQWTRQVEFPNLAPGVAQDVRRYALRL